jgi:glycosyltransferase involved in cell wall biosynthesis
VGYIGRLSEQKNVPILLQAARRLQQSQFVLIGTGDLEAQLEASAADLPNVRFLGYLPEAHALLPAFDALCLPSKWEGLGLVLVEAMWCNVPIVGSAAGAIPEMLGDGDYGLLFDPDDVQSLVTALQAVPQRGAALAQRARADVGTRFGVPAMVERTLAVYRRLTDTRLG